MTITTDKIALLKNSEISKYIDVTNEVVSEKSNYVPKDTNATDISAFVHVSFLMNTFSKIARLAIDNRLRFIPLKGTSIIIRGYDKLYVRPMSDIDLLIQPDDFLPWKKLFYENGYTPLSFSLSSFIKRYNAPAVFDLHSSLTHINKNIVDIAWKETTKKEYRDINYELLPIEIDVLYQCLHMTVTHGYGGRKWMRDINTLLCEYKQVIDWERLVAYTCDCFAASPLVATLKYLQTHYSTPVPGGVIKDLESHTSRKITVLFSYVVNHRKNILFFEYIAPILLQSSMIKIFVIAWGKLFPSISIMQKRYCVKSKGAAVIMYPVRVVSLVGKAMCAICIAFIKLITLKKQ